MTANISINRGNEARQGIAVIDPGVEDPAQ